MKNNIIKFNDHNTAATNTHKILNKLSTNTLITYATAKIQVIAHPPSSRTPVSAHPLQPISDDNCNIIHWITFTILRTHTKLLHIVTVHIAA